MSDLEINIALANELTQQQLSLGYFHDLDAAKKCYNDFASNYYGEFANF